MALPNTTDVKATKISKADKSSEKATLNALTKEFQERSRLEKAYNKQLEQDERRKLKSNENFIFKYRQQAVERLNELYADDVEKRDEEINKVRERAQAALTKKLAAQEKKDRMEVNEAILSDRNASKEEKKAALKQEAKDVGMDILNKSMNKLINVMDDLKTAFNNNIDTYAKYQGAINARIQGSGKSWQGTFGFGGIESTLSKNLGTNPYVKLTDVYENLSKLVDAGIVYNVEQRAFLQTVASDIATTFDAANGTLLRLIRVQQSDTTAARLGMEAALTKYLNTNVLDTEYLTNEFDNVSSALLEASAQMGSEQAVEFEYVVQKWLGTLSGIGISDEAATNIAKAIGYLGSGDITSLSNNSTIQNLLVMASNKAGLNYSDMLTQGLDASTTNKLLKSIVSYIQEIASTDNKVVRAEYASVFGLSASDLVAIKNNLTNKQIDNISASMMSYSDTIAELGDQLNTLPSRISTADMLSNLYDNITWAMSTGIASSPILYSLWKVTGLIEDLTGGIAIPTISVMGNTVDLNTTATNLMRAGIVGVSSLSAIGDIINGLQSTFSPLSMLGSLGITQKASMLTRGEFLPQYVSGLITNTTSASAFVGNASASDMYKSTITAANEQAEAQKASVEQVDESAQQMKEIHDAVILLANPDKLFKTVNYKVIDNITGEVNGGSAIFDNKNTVKVTPVDDNTSAVYVKTISENVQHISSILDSVVLGGMLKVRIMESNTQNSVSRPGGL